MITRVRTAVCIGIEGKPVEVQADVNNGLPFFNIVGLAASTVIESRDRIKSALQNSGYEYPRGRITINLAPATFRKTGSHLDLPIAVALMGCEGYIDPGSIDKTGFVGELALDGRIVSVEGVLPMVLAMADAGIKRIIAPADNCREASLATGVEIVPAADIVECIEMINGVLEPVAIERQELAWDQDNPYRVDFSDIRGQDKAKRAMVIAATGRHGMLMIGSPGCGKSMMASRIPTIMPDMSFREMIECTVISSVMGKIDPELGAVRERPFRKPHNSISRAGLLGGGRYPVPGEITLAHNGVLFLDEVCEFKRDVIESLRIPMEEKRITHSRSGNNYTFPANTLLIMASNPCPCGYYGDPEHVCTCTQNQIEQYRKKLSGPLRQRLDIEIHMEKVDFDEIASDKGAGMDSATMKRAVISAREFAAAHGRTLPNGDMTDREVETMCVLGDDERRFMESAYRRLKLSPRLYIKTLKVARTIADLDGSVDIRTQDLAEALNYREEGGI